MCGKVQRQQHGIPVEYIGKEQQTRMHTEVRMDEKGVAECYDDL